MDWCCWHALNPAQDRILLPFKAIMIGITVREQQHFGALYLCPAVSAPFLVMFHLKKAQQQSCTADFVQAEPNAQSWHFVVVFHLEFHFPGAVSRDSRILCSQDLRHELEVEVLCGHITSLFILCPTILSSG